ncbi:Phospholipid N-methyltransferase [Marininema mesophilum]|uniref:Phospholipid N-methyltransferase n=1 Tax=Marininema mesophilum TaxID=1048340 RepID=A0A1H3A232_9BACL|nr:methyltransferase [Marininema mesophilum]SDX22979.1 Phospholipid N-methyltransferase [Marininema mesophilum]
MTDSLEFLKGFLRAPRQVGSIIPSSPFLVRSMLNVVDREKMDTVVELGAGTGVITKSLIRQLSSDAQLYIFEKDPRLCFLLEQEFPELYLTTNAEELGRVLNQYGNGHADIILSSLPFANFPQAKRTEILDQIQAHLSPDGVFVAYQYSLQMKSLLQRRFRSVEVKFVPLNIPSAFVYVCKEPYERVMRVNGEQLVEQLNVG